MLSALYAIGRPSVRPSIRVRLSVHHTGVSIIQKWLKLGLLNNPLVFAG